MVLLIGALIIFHLYFSKDIPRIDVLFIVTASAGIALYILINEKTMVKKILIAPAIIILSVNYYLNRQFYPSLLPYQSESEVAFYIKNHHLPAEKLIFLDENQWITDFYLKKNVPMYSFVELRDLNIRGNLVYTNSTGLEKLTDLQIAYQILQTFPDFHVTTLNKTFINQKTRDKSLQTKYLLKIKE
jgi:hypothetical protein